jgi:hypothetical protein
MLITRSTDNGAHWTEIPVPGNPFYRTQCMSSLEETPVFLGGISGRYIAMSSDHGTSWSLDTLFMDTSASFSYFNAIAVTPGGRAIAVVAKGITQGASGYILLGEPLSGVSAKSDIASATAQFYPNPATTVLNIVSPNGNETIHLYDMLGREARSGVLPASGQATLDVSHIPRGIYSVVLEHNGLLIPAGKIAVVRKE